MGNALRVIDEIKEEVARSPEAIPQDSYYRKLLESFPLRPIEKEGEHKLATHIVSRLLDLLADPAPEVDAVRIDIEHYLKALAQSVEHFEKETYPTLGKNVSGREMLAFLLECNGLQQGDLKKELGGQPVVSAILRGARKLNVRQITALSKRFNISPAVFIDLNEEVRVQPERAAKRK